MMTKVVLELSFNDDDSNKKTMRAPAKAKSKPVAIQKAKKVVKESVSEDDDGDDGDDSSFNLIMELNTESKKKTPSIPRKILPKKKMTAMTKTIRKKKTTAKKMEEHELSGDDDLFSDKQEELQANVKLPGKSLTKMSKDSVSGDDASVEGKPSRRSVAPSNLETLKKTRKSATKQVAWEDYDAYDIVLPSNLINISNGECTLLVQIDPDDAVTLDFTGAMGAVGRMEADDDRVILDLKGTQYIGKMFPGPTALVLAVNINTNADPYLKVEGITDEFCSLFKTGDVMAKMEEAVQHGMEEHFHYEDEDVNRSAKTDATATANVATADGATTKNMADLKKRKRPAASTRRRKSKR